MSGLGQMTDFDFLTHPVSPRSHFLYVYTTESGFLRARVREHVMDYGSQAGWTAMAVWPGASLHGTLAAASHFDNPFYVCDAADFAVNDLDAVMSGIANDAFDSHVCLFVSNRSKLLERPSWLAACSKVGSIKEPIVTIENYRGITRRILEMSDLRGVDGFGEDRAFLAHIRAFVQERRDRSPFNVAAEIDRIVLTETKGDQVRPRAPAKGDDRREKLGELMARFLDDRTSASFYPLLQFVGTALHATKDSDRLLGRLFKSATSIVSGSDQRYKRNREGNPAVLPYLAWGMMLLRSEAAMRDGSFVVAFEQICQAYHKAYDGAPNWFADPQNWQHSVKGVTYQILERPSAVDRARNELSAALRARILNSSVDELQWLKSIASEFERETFEGDVRG